MWSGVEPDVELYASGRVLDDDGEWSGAQTLADTAGPACIGLLPMSLSHMHASRQGSATNCMSLMVTGCIILHVDCSDM